MATVAALFGLAMVAAITVDAESMPAPVGFGMDSGSAARQANAGAAPDYGTFWVGPWTLSSGWGGPDAQMVAMRDAGITPAIHFYYWGDDISEDCIENGCWSSLHDTQKDRASWDELSQQFVDHLNANMDGKPVVIFLETEFNKKGVATYEPLDGYLEEKALFFHQHYPAAKVVMALGNWNSAAWETWDRTAAASDYTGIQGLRSSAHHSLSEYMNLDDSLVQGAQTLQTLFAKPVFIQDIGLSSYPEPTYLDHQADALAEVFAAMPDLKAAGVMAIIYRGWTDSPNMDLANHHGEAERHWGFAWSGNNTLKPSAQVWIDGVAAERAGSSISTGFGIASSGTTWLEAEAFEQRANGGIQADPTASGGERWNQWSNGAISQAFDFPEAGEYGLAVVARGTPLAGVAPHMEVRLGLNLVLTADPASDVWEEFVAAVNVSSSGVQTLEIRFTNDALSDTEDRNLLVDAVEWTAKATNQPPTAAFDLTKDGLNVHVDAAASSDPDGDPLTYEWAWGDGASSTGVIADHEYAAAGTYEVTLTVSDGSIPATSSHLVETSQPNQPPVAGFSTAMNGLELTVDASESSDPDGDAISYAWTFGDGAVASGQVVNHTYEAADTFTVRLTVADRTSSTTATKNVTAKGPFATSFDPSPNVNEWWVEVRVTASEEPASVEAKVNDEPWLALGKTDWGTWAKSFKAPQGSTMAFRATSASGETVTSDRMTWLKEPMTATFDPSPNVNEWWVEVRVTASEEPASVEAKVNDEPWVALAKTDWGTWAKSFKAPQGSTMAFRATSASGETVTSDRMTWLKEPMTATFTPKTQTNNWWVEVRVSASDDLTRVDARLDGGPWISLAETEWDSWAKSVHAPNGTQVEFRATGSSGATVTSGVYVWG